MGATRSGRGSARRWRAVCAGLSLGLALVVGCASIAGLDGDYVLGEPNGSGASATAGSGGAGASGAMGGSTSSGGSTTSGGTGGSSTTTGGAGGLGGSGGGGAGQEVLKQVVDSLDGLRVEFPCLDDGDPYCGTSGTVEDVAVSAGDPGDTYDVTVHIQGVVEMDSYQGGTANGQLYVGGQPLDDWNTYGLQVTDPPQTYYVNNGPCCFGYCEEIDIQTTIQVTSGATVTLWGDDRNGLSTRNMDLNGNPIVINGVPSAPADGQFVQLRAQNATLAQ